jgi:hypothetical protein
MPLEISGKMEDKEDALDQKKQEPKQQQTS